MPDTSTRLEPALDPRVWELWGKADPKRKGVGPEWHPVLCHVLDVVACAQLLLTEVQPESLRSHAEAMRLSEKDALAWILFAVALHDLGKLTPPFQAKVLQRASVLRGMGLDFPRGKEPHGSMSTVLVVPELERLGCPRRLAMCLADAVGAHHGDFATNTKINAIGQDPGKNAGSAPLWAEMRGHFVRAVGEVTGVNAARAPQLPTPTSRRNAFCADIAGLTTVADWLGSNADIFEYVEPPSSPAAYFASSLLLAKTSLEGAGFRSSPKPRARSFENLFGRTPWPLHDAMGRVLEQLEPGSLVIVEAPMGEGKTEAALLLYDALASRGAEGLYFALPTQATANQILGRVWSYLDRSFPGERHGLHLVHGGAGLSDRYGELKMKACFSTASVDGVARSADDQGAIADAWFARSKRALLAPIAVGTVDQALLGVLRSKHHFLRLHGLARKVVIVDEVHAYDTFTSEILARLCAWLRSLRTTVVLLSATLSSPQRTRLLNEHDVKEAPALAPYPRVVVARDGAVHQEPFPARRPPVAIALTWKPAAALPAAVAEAVKLGGCVAWIVNTVARAQAIYQMLADLHAGGEMAADVELTLLHARFPFEARQRRERAAEDAFGPPEKAKTRPRAAIVVGTQVLEQSLDLDFDLMVTELAPVDLILQRAGRLHRHDRSDRPDALRAPELWVTLPEAVDAETGPTFGSSAFIYNESVLLRTWLALSKRASLTIPTEVEPLVEIVYAPLEEPSFPPPIVARLRTLDHDRTNEDRRDGANAEERELPHPEESSPFCSFSVRFDEEDPEIHAALRAVTRLGEESVTVVPVRERGGRLVLANDSEEAVDVRAESLPFGAILAIARQALTLSHKTVVSSLLREDPPACFQRSGHLRHHRLLRLDDAGEAEVDGVRLRLDPELGLVVGVAPAQP